MKISAICFTLYVSLAASVIPSASSQSLDHEKPSQKTAEEVGGRILKRLHEARDVAPIFREYFVSDASMRRREVQLVFGRRLPRNRGQIEHSAIERAYIALWNFWIVLSTYRYANEAEFEPPKEIENAYNVKKLDLEKISTTRELDEQFTSNLNGFIDVVWKHIPQDVFDSEVYKRNWAAFKEEEETADVEQMRREFGLSKEKEIYVVKREFFNYFLIQEGDTLKVFTTSLRTKKRF